MSLEMKIKETVKEFKQDPRNKVFVGFPLLILSACEETGLKILADQLKQVIARYLGGKMKSSDESIYDGAVAACGEVARRCFGENPDDDIDYSIDWIEEVDGGYTAEVRPN